MLGRMWEKFQRQIHYLPQPQVIHQINSRDQFTIYPSHRFYIRSIPETNSLPTPVTGYTSDQFITYPSHRLYIRSIPETNSLPTPVTGYSSDQFQRPIHYLPQPQVIHQINSRDQFITYSSHRLYIRSIPETNSLPTPVTGYTSDHLSEILKIARQSRRYSGLKWSARGLDKIVKTDGHKRSDQNWWSKMAKNIRVEIPK